MKQRSRAARHEERAAEGAAAQERGAKLMKAFEQDRFVMDEVAPPLDVSRKAQRTSEHMLGVAEAALAVLTPQQRVLAAQKLRDRAESRDEVAPGMP
jgi:hypothetical protein